MAGDHTGPRRKIGEGSIAHLDLVPYTRRIKALRLARGWTQSALAERAGLATNHYQCIERAEINPGLRSLLCIAQALDITVSELLSTA